MVPNHPPRRHMENEGVELAAFRALRVYRARAVSAEENASPPKVDQLPGAIRGDAVEVLFPRCLKARHVLFGEGHAGVHTAGVARKAKAR